MITNAIEKALSKKIGCMQVQGPNETTQGVANQYFKYDTDKGVFFVKTQHSPDITPFAAEARALQLIDETNTIRVPLPNYYGTCKDECFLILENIDLFPHTETSMALLGQQLAQMHMKGKESRFGFDMNNTIGATPQINDWSEEWVEFFREQRLECQLQLIEDRYHDNELLSAAERIIEKLPHYFQGVAITPSLLHGDLWHANTAADKEGQPVVFDPSSYYGHSEADLCMAKMFGGFPPAFFEAYHAVIPQAPGFESRQKLYSLYHALNHYNIFGVGYRKSCLQLLSELLTE
jgi:protein-ribulosamine 3-kinase